MTNFQIVISIFFLTFYFQSNAVLAADPYLPEPAQQAKLKKLSKAFKTKSVAARTEAHNEARKKGWPIREELSNGKLIELQRINKNGQPEYFQTDNINAADTLSTDEVWPGGSAGLFLTGSSLYAELGQWDGGGVFDIHQEFNGRVLQRDIPVASHYHATHVAGTMIASGVDPAAKGMANEAILNAYDWNDDSNEMSIEASAGMLLSNHSYGAVAGWTTSTNCGIELPHWAGSIGVDPLEDYQFGFYDNNAADWDMITYNAPYYLIVKSAGNDRSETGPAPGSEHCIWDVNQYDISTEIRNADCGPDGYDCIPGAGTAKNILTVGAVNDISGGYSSPSDVVMSDFSGWGPTDDGRIKPDIVTNGIGLYSSMDSGDSAYALLSGTSMAAPGATGSLLLLQEHYRNLHFGGPMRSATLKALVIHTADEAGAADGPDYEHGWGLLNTQSAARVITEDGGEHHIIEETLNNGEHFSFQFDVNEPDAVVTVTLVWTDPPAIPPFDSLDPIDKMLVHDLDLRVDDITNVYEPWVLDPYNPSYPATTGDNDRDNVEQVRIVGAASDSYFINIGHKRALTTGSQDFSLIISVTPRKDIITIIQTQDFESGLSFDWMSGSNTPDAFWRLDDPAIRGNRTGGSGQFAIIDSNYAGPVGEVVDAELVRVNLDFSNYSSVFLKFKTFFEYFEGNLDEKADVDISNDGGINWTNIWRRSVDVETSTQTIDITNEAAGQPDVMIRFHYYNADFEFYWQVDDVEIYGQSVGSGNPCGNAYSLPQDQWHFISLPCDPGPGNTILDIFGDDLDPANYAITWILWEKAETNDSYFPIMDVNIPLQQGKGYYIYSYDEAQLDMTGTETPLVSHVGCPTTDKLCYELPVVKPEPGLNLFNALGHPFPYPVNWADVRIFVWEDSDSPMTPSEAQAKNYISKVIHKYTGNSFVPYDDVTPGYDEGVLETYDGFWVEALHDSFTIDNISLLIPTDHLSGGITSAVQEPQLNEKTALAGNSTFDIEKNSSNWLKLFSWLISDAVAFKPDDKAKIPPGLAKRDAHRKGHREKVKRGDEWYVRLIIEAPDEQLRDDGNILGQLYDSQLGYDEHDLVEPSPNTPYLTIIFLNEYWEENNDTYTSDYHPVTTQNVLDQWSFEVRSDDPARKMVLHWQGLDDVLKVSRLIDQDTGEIIEPGAQGNYSFVMNAKQRRFIWEYKKKPGNSARK